MLSAAAAAVTVAAVAAPTAAVAACPDTPIRPTVDGRYPAGCFVYELVSPPYKHNGQVGGGGLVVSGIRLSESGDHALYMVDAPILGATSFGQSTAIYGHRSGAGWSNDALSRILPLDLTTEGTPNAHDATLPMVLSPNGRWTYSGSNVDPETKLPVPSRGYVTDLLNATSTRFTPTPPGGGLAMVGEGYGTGVIVGDNERVVLTSTTPMSPDVAGASSAPRVFSFENGQATLVSRDAAGAVSLGNLADRSSPPAMRSWSVADDGQTVWWTPANNGVLYRGSVTGVASTAVNASENTITTVPLAGATPISASADGRRIAFISSQKLMNGTDALPNGDRIYLYTHSANPAVDRNLTLVSTAGEPADTSALAIVKNAQMSPDGRTIYFWTTGKQLVAGGPIGGGQKLYRWQDGQLTYLLTAAVTAGSQLSVVSDDGRFYAFDSPTQLTAKPTGNQQQRYLYDARTGKLDCASCPRSGTPGAVQPRNQVSFTIGMTERRFLSTDGQVIFETPTPLVPEDTNGLVDVYAFKDGRTTLISTGTSDSPARFGDATPDGTTIGFVTSQRLSAWDFDERKDLYVARRDGGVPEPAPQADPTCSGDACQGPVIPWAPGPRTGTSSFVGAGDPPVADAPAAPRKMTIAAPRTVRGRVAKLRVSVPGKGSIRVTGDGVRRASGAASSARTVSVSVRLSDRAKRRLARRGRVEVRVTVRYAPATGAVQTSRVRVTFKQAKGASSAGAGAKGGR